MLKSPVSSNDRSTEPREVERAADAAEPVDEVLGFLEPINGLADAAAVGHNGTSEAATDAVISSST